MGLLPGSPLTPWLVAGIVRLGASVPFAEAARLLAHFTGVRVGAETVRRLTEAAGAAQVAVETDAVAALERTLPDGPCGPAVQLLSVDGAMVPLRGGAWAEVKTLAVGEVVPGADAPRTTALSYFSRLTDAATFGRLATGETHRRGTATAGTVVAVNDGAAWCQGFVDLHRPDAVRVLDFPHAVEHLGLVAQAVFGPGTAAGSEWLGRQAHALRHGQEDAVLAALADLVAGAGRGTEARDVVAGVAGYLGARREQIRYQAFAAAGYPLGSGCVESANKLVVEARLKGAGMHWARPNVDPLLALRSCWRTAAGTTSGRRCGGASARPARRSSSPGHPPPRPAPAPAPRPRAAAPPCRRRPRPKTIVNGRPTLAHPWKRRLARRAKP